MLTSELVGVPVGEVVRQFGEDFANKAEELPIGRWEGPAPSGYGDHLVFVAERTPGRMPTLGEVRDQVAREWADARREEGDRVWFTERAARLNDPEHCRAEN